MSHSGPHSTIRSVLFFALVFLLIVPTLSSAQSGLWGGELVSKVDSLATATLRSGPVASLAIGIKRGDDILMTKAYGLADIENSVPATAESVYRIGSVTKQFTAAAVMQLAEEGKIRLYDPITKFLPDYPTQGHTVTIEHLLNHTSGIKSYTSLESWMPTIPLPVTDEELLALFEDLPFDFAPGDEFRYNNSGYYLLGMIISKISGLSYSGYLDEHIFGPLGLSNTTYCDERRILKGRAEGYQAVEGELLNDIHFSMNHPGAAGALCSTVPDLLRWSAALRRGDVVSRSSYERMTATSQLNDGSDSGYGLGLFVGDLDGHVQIHHGGGIPGFSTMMSHFPESDLDVVVLASTEGPGAGDVAKTISQWALGVQAAEMLDEPVEPEEFELYTGVYEMSPGFELTIFEKNGLLFSQATGQPAYRLRNQGNHVFIPTFSETVTATFVIEAGQATSVLLF